MLPDVFIGSFLPLLPPLFSSDTPLSRSPLELETDEAVFGGDGSDTMGYAWSYPLVRLLAGQKVPIGAYVHYPTIRFVFSHPPTPPLSSPFPRSPPLT